MFLNIIINQTLSFFNSGGILTINKLSDSPVTTNSKMDL